jgi:hypothetical protein
MDVSVATRRVPPASARVATTSAVGRARKGQEAGKRRSVVHGRRRGELRMHHGRCPWLAGSSAKGRRKTKLCRRAESNGIHGAQQLFDEMTARKAAYQTIAPGRDVLDPKGLEQGADFILLRYVFVCDLNFEFFFYLEFCPNLIPT